MPDPISVIMPVYNGARFLAEAITSIRVQQQAGLELIVIDDGSDDGSADLARRLGADIQVIQQANQGPAAARNSGLAAATGNLITFLDADDRWPAGRIERQLAYLAAYPELDVLLGHVQLYVRPEPDSDWRLLEQRVLAPMLGSMLCRRSVFERVGRFKPELRQGEDSDWLLRVREADVQIGAMPDPALYYRIHESNMMRNGGDMRRFLLTVLRQSLQRRRAAEGGSELAPIPILPALRRSKV
jgi:glycosyltransferase involved in cell wall biosynthesis